MNQFLVNLKVLKSKGLRLTVATLGSTAFLPNIDNLFNKLNPLSAIS
jgi:hypothetical protein